jgi:hypothetical protein
MGSKIRTFFNYKGLTFKCLDRNAITENNKIREVEKDQFYSLFVLSGVVN